MASFSTTELTGKGSPQVSKQRDPWRGTLPTDRLESVHRRNAMRAAGSVRSVPVIGFAVHLRQHERVTKRWKLATKPKQLRHVVSGTKSPPSAQSGNQLSRFGQAVRAADFSASHMSQHTARNAAIAATTADPSKKPTRK